MHVTVNGSPEELQEGATLTDLIDKMGLAGKRVAVEKNHEIVPRSRHADERLTDGDTLEIIQAIGGG
ncbi:MAG: sulfur carrier protein ThiS [Pseudomonadota bacterium]|nr:sulfur carrier protein ThiS [Pseudomonadota bacterium]